MRPNELIVSGRPGSFRRVLATIPLLLFVTLAPTSAWSQTPPPLAPRDMAMTMPGTFTFVSVGDIIIKTPISRLADENVQAALRLIREGDVAFGNLEGNLADFRSYRGLLTGSQGRPADLVASAEVARDLKPMGFDLVNRANNHLFDNELEGMVETSRLLDEVGIVHAGSGRNLDEAAAPAFLETPKGRAALVGMNTPGLSELEHLAATSRTGNLNGKPGLNMLRYSAQIVLTRGQVDALRQIQDELLEYGDRYDNPSSARDLGPDRVTFYGSPPGRDPIFRVARVGEVPGTIDYTLNRGDVERALRSIRNAKQYSDFVIATIHSHERQSVVETGTFSTRPPDFYVELARAAIDAGADVWVGHGVHTLRGIEIYRGKPIFYGMGLFVRQLHWTLAVQFGMTDWLPDPFGIRGGNAMPPESSVGQALESIVGVSRYEDGKLVEVLVYPIDLRYDEGEPRPDSRFGIPQIAPPELGRRILQRVQRLSRELGTEMTIEGNRGVIRVAEYTP